MIADGYFQISVIDGALELLKYQQRYNIQERRDAITHLRVGPSHAANLDYDAALKFAEIVGWSAFEPATDRATEMRNTLLNLVRRVRPLWAQACPYGRERVRRIVNEDQAQCLRSAGLLDTDLNEEGVHWWDTVATFFRALQDERNLDVGRKGEQLTLSYEKARLDELDIELEPKWLAIEDNLYGFDILSYDKDLAGEIHDLKIEVKATTLNDLSFTVTRREWEIASEDALWHRFYIWRLEYQQLTILRVEDIAQHIPIDTGKGKWLQVRVII